MVFDSKIFEWASQRDQRPANGSLIQLITTDGKTEFVPTQWERNTVYILSCCCLVLKCFLYQFNLVIRLMYSRLACSQSLSDKFASPLLMATSRARESKWRKASAFIFESLRLISTKSFSKCYETKRSPSVVTDRVTYLLHISL